MPVCESCKHLDHVGRECGAPITQDIDDTVGLFGPCSGEVFTIIKALCRCGR